MVVEDGVVTVEAGAALAEAIAAAEASGRRVVLVHGGLRYRVERDASTFTPIGPPAEDAGRTAPSTEAPGGSVGPTSPVVEAWAGVDRAAGTWDDVDTEKLKADIYRWREEGSRPWDRP